MTEEYIHYDQLIDQAMRSVVLDSLKILVKDGLSGNHFFLISFLTSSKGVQIPLYLKEKYPHEMTIVLQHQYEDLRVYKDHFKVSLSFEGNKEQLTIPIDALTSFADPGVKFGLKFNLLDNFDSENKIKKEIINVEKKPVKKTKDSTKNNEEENVANNNVVDLAKFRGKKDK